MIREISMMQLRSMPGEIVDRIRLAGDTFVLTRAGKQVAIITSIPKIGNFDSYADVPIEVLPDGSTRVQIDG